ncbi:MAG: hypothetical protein E5Y77_15050 [Mesorhizobium sp.]|nr:MAG: hypothetical protein E5Y77_15050 [Mesorhizobium sp.]
MGVPAWHQQRSGQHPSSVLALRANPPSPTRGEGKTGPRFRPSGPGIVSPGPRLAPIRRTPPSTRPWNRPDR